MNSLSLKLEEYALEKLFSEARTHNAWQDKVVAPELLQELYDLLKMAPTSANCSPARFVFIHPLKQEVVR